MRIIELVMTGMYREESLKFMQLVEEFAQSKYEGET